MPAAPPTGRGGSVVAAGVSLELPYAGRCEHVQRQKRTSTRSVFTLNACYDSIQLLLS